MSDLFTSLAAQALGIAPSIRPQVAPMFASGAPLASEMPLDIMGEASWADANPPAAPHSVAKTAPPGVGTEADLDRTNTQVQPWAHPIGQPQYHPSSVSSPDVNPDGISGNPSRSLDPSVSLTTAPIALDPLFPMQPSAMAPPEQPPAHPPIAHAHELLQPKFEQQSSLPSPDARSSSPVVTVPLSSTAATPSTTEARGQRPVDSLPLRSVPEMLINDISINNISINDLEVKPTTRSQLFSQPSFSLATPNQINDQSTDDVEVTRTVRSDLFQPSFPVTIPNQATSSNQINPVQSVFAAGLPSSSIAVPGNVVPGNSVIQRQVDLAIDHTLSPTRDSIAQPQQLPNPAVALASPALSASHNPVIQHRIDPAIDPMVPSPMFPITPLRMEPLVNSPSPTALTVQGKNLSLSNGYSFHNQLADTRSMSRLNETASTQAGQPLTPVPDLLQNNQLQRHGTVQDSTIQAEDGKLNRSEDTLITRSLQSASQPDQRNWRPRSTIASSRWHTHNAAIAPFTTELQNLAFKHLNSTLRNQQTELSESIQPFATASTDPQDVSHPIRPASTLRALESSATNSSFINQTDMGLPSAPAMPSFRLPTSESKAFPLAPDVPVRRSNGVSPPLIPSVEPLDGARFQTRNRMPEIRSSSNPRSSSTPSAQTIPLQTLQESGSNAAPIQPNRLSDDGSKALPTDSVSTDSVLRAPVISTTGQQDLISSTSIHSIFNEGERRGILLSNPVGEQSLSRLESVANIQPEAQREREISVREMLGNAHTNDDPHTQTFAAPDRPADHPTQMESLTQDARWLQRLTRDRPVAQPPSIRVSIGRIRLAAPTPIPPAPQFSRPSPSLSLDQYLSRRQERQ